MEQTLELLQTVKKCPKHTKTHILGTANLQHAAGQALFRKLLAQDMIEQANRHAYILTAKGKEYVATLQHITKTLGL